MHILAELDPLSPGTGTRPTLRLSSAQDRRLTGLDGKRWWPGIVKKPTTSIQLFDGDFDTGASAGSASLEIAMRALTRQDGEADGYIWQGCPLRLYAGQAGDAWPWTMIFRGKVSDFQVKAGKVSLSADVDEEPFQAKLLSAEYAGTSGIEGGEDRKGTLKPWVLGRVLNIEPVQIDAANYVYQASAYGPVKLIEAVYERGAQFPASLGDYPSYAALMAATVPEGRWASCNALGLIRLGAPPYGVITADVMGDYTGGAFAALPGAIIRRVCAILDIDESRLDLASIKALDTAMAALPDGGVMGFYLTEQQDALTFAKDLAEQCNAQAGLSLTGKLFFSRVGFGVPIAALDAQGRQMPAITDSAQASVSTPFSQIKMAGARCWRVHTMDEIAYGATPVEKGAYSPDTVYRLGNIVSMPDGSRWIYDLDTPSSGNVPGEASIYWALMSGPLTAGNITYEDGTPVESLKPAEGGADVTGDHTAADTAAVGGKSSSTLLAEVAAVQSQADTIHSDLAAAVSDIGATTDALQAQATAAAGTIAAQGGEIDNLQQLSATQGASIATNAQAISNAAGDLATLTQTVMAGGANLWKYGGLEAGLNGYTGANWALRNANGWGPYLDATAVGTYDLATDYIDVTAGTAYCWSADLHLSVLASLTSVYVDIQWYDAANVRILDGANSAPKALGQSFGVTRTYISQTAPTGAVKARARIVVDGKTSTTGNVGVRRMKFERGTKPTGWTGEAGVTQVYTALSATDLQVASVQSDLATVNSAISTNQQAISGLNSSVATVSQRVTTAEASVETLSEAMTDVEGKQAAYLQIVAAAGSSSAAVRIVADGQSSGIEMQADAIRLGDDKKAAMDILNGTVLFHGEVLAESISTEKLTVGGVTTDRIAGGAITNISNFNWSFDVPNWRVLDYPVSGTVRFVGLNQTFTLVKQRNDSALDITVEYDLKSENDLATRTQIIIGGVASQHSPGVIAIVSDGGRDTFMTETRSYVFDGINAGSYTVSFQAGVYFNIAGYPSGDGLNYARVSRVRVIEYKR